VNVGGTTGEARSDESDLARLYRDEFPTLMRVAYLMTGSNEAAEDAVQDAFLRCRSKLSGLDHPPSYLRTAVVNECRSLHRRSKRRPADPEYAPHYLPTDLVDLRDALGRLPARQRAAIVLRYFVDIPDDQIADALSCRPSTVRSLIRRGVTTLREVLQ
jgi:DNA-directed RNA polymerase specialized sigma24 family protein